MTEKYILLFCFKIHNKMSDFEDFIVYFCSRTLVKLINFWLQLLNM